MEFETPGGIIYLHNCARIEGLYLFPGKPTLAFEFRYSPDWRAIETVGRMVRLEFSAIQDLRISQAADYDPRAADTLEGIIHSTASGHSLFRIDMGDLSCSFVAELVKLTA
ncbi:hypothetical protein AB0C10_09555 [Microbispora amethystogenes]|uniref:hypothetical protein n=1 Tax=Microbispora amethystogenes TaxID=1427754 RepID=UPI0033E51B4E